MHAFQGFLKQMMDMAAAEGAELDALFIMDNVIILLWAGTDTTASTLVTMLMKLQSHPKVYTHLRSELEVSHVILLWAGTDTTASTLVTMLMKLQSHPEVYTRLRSELEVSHHPAVGRHRHHRLHPGHHAHEAAEPPGGLHPPPQ
jgi:cytochrome P450